jgi:hypothetical protein
MYELVALDAVKPEDALTGLCMGVILNPYHALIGRFWNKV